MREVGAFEAKSRFGQLLERVEAGEEVVITRRGRVVAKLVAPTTAGADRAGAAAERIRAMRRGVTLGGATIKELIDEGRR